MKKKYPILEGVKVEAVHNTFPLPIGIPTILRPHFHDTRKIQFFNERCLACVILFNTRYRPYSEDACNWRCCIAPLYRKVNKECILTWLPPEILKKIESFLWEPRREVVYGYLDPHNVPLEEVFYERTRELNQVVQHRNNLLMFIEGLTKEEEEEK